MVEVDEVETTLELLVVEAMLELLLLDEVDVVLAGADEVVLEALEEEVVEAIVLEVVDEDDGVLSVVLDDEDELTLEEVDAASEDVRGVVALTIEEEVEVEVEVLLSPTGSECVWVAITVEPLFVSVHSVVYVVKLVGLADVEFALGVIDDEADVPVGPASDVVELALVYEALDEADPVELAETDGTPEADVVRGAEWV